MIPTLTTAQARDFRTIVRGGLWSRLVPRPRKLLNRLCVLGLVVRERRYYDDVLDWSATPLGRAWLAAHPEPAA